MMHTHSKDENGVGLTTFRLAIAGNTSIVLDPSSVEDGSGGNVLGCAKALGACGLWKATLVA
jgi:hypothetical protein